MGRSRLTRARIVSTAVQMADREGLEAVTLRRLAGRLRVHVTSLYNHVPTKEAVLDGMVESLIEEARLPTGEMKWEEWIRRFATALRSVARKHPGAFAVLHHRPVQGAQAALWAEAGLAAFRAGGFGPAQAYGALKSTTLAVLGLILDDLAGLRAPNLGTDLSLLPPERFPRIHEASAAAGKADACSYLIESLIRGFADTPPPPTVRPIGALSEPRSRAPVASGRRSDRPDRRGE
jgi:AcrR family transcriptional regulator